MKQRETNANTDVSLVNGDANQQPAENRVSARYLDDNHTELYKSFPETTKMCKNTFFNYLNASGEFKKPHRLIFCINKFSLSVWLIC